MLSHTLGANIDIRLDLGRDLPLALADKGQLEAVLVNLAANSRDAMQDGGAIIISAETETVAAGKHEADLRPGSYIRLAVADNGIGMDAALLKRAVEPFFTTKGPGKGTGLGLSMARGFAEQSQRRACRRQRTGARDQGDVMASVRQRRSDAANARGTTV